jgi:transglutaminase-like putative cysteine protease
MLLRVSHLTRYDYSQDVSFSPHVLYLRPRESPLHRLRSFRYELSPKARLVTTQDPQDNVLTLAHFLGHSSILSFQSDFEIETLDTNPFDFLLKTSAIKYPVTYDKAEQFALAPYLAPPFNETQTALRAWVAAHLPDAPPETTPFLAALTSILQESITYVRRETGRSQPSARTLALGSGSCRDFAVLLIETCRTLGFAARFVSGYLYDPPAADAVDPAPGAMHAWVEVYLPGAGWKGLDPTRGIFCDDSFIPVAHAAQADVVTPIQGNYYAAIPVSAKLTTSVVVEKLPN